MLARRSPAPPRPAPGHETGPSVPGPERSAQAATGARRGWRARRSRSGGPAGAAGSARDPRRRTAGSNDSSRRRSCAGPRPRPGSRRANRPPPARRPSRAPLGPDPHLELAAGPVERLAAARRSSSGCASPASGSGTEGSPYRSAAAAASAAGRPSTSTRRSIRTVASLRSVRSRTAAAISAARMGAAPAYPTSSTAGCRRERRPARSSAPAGRPDAMQLLVFDQPSRAHGQVLGASPARFRDPRGRREPTPGEGPTQFDRLTHHGAGSEVFFGGKRRHVGQPEPGQRSPCRSTSIRNCRPPGPPRPPGGRRPRWKTLSARWSCTESGASTSTDVTPGRDGRLAATPPGRR